MATEKENKVNKQGSNKGKRDYKKRFPNPKMDHKEAGDFMPKGKVQDVKTNPPELYYPDETIGRAVASLPYNIPTGMDFRAYRSSTSGDEISDFTGASVPALMRIDYIPAYGSFQGATAAVNVAARALDTTVRKANSGSKNYESADLMTYFLAMDQVYTMLMHIKKIMRSVGMFNYMNRTLPIAVIERGLLVSYDDLKSNFAQYRAKFNLLVRKVNQAFAVPNTFKLFVRRAILEMGIFADSTSPRGQAIVFRPSGYYEWTGTEAGGSALKYKALPTIPETLDAKLDRVSAMVDALSLEQDIAIMSGDVLKAFGKENCFVLSYLEENEYQTELIYNEDILSQIENMTICSFASDGTSLVTPGDITQSNNLLSCTFSAKNSIETRVMFGDGIPLNSHKDEPDFKDNIEYTRLTAYITDPYVTFNSPASQINFSSEYISGVYIFTVDRNQSSRAYMEYSLGSNVLILDFNNSNATINTIRDMYNALSAVIALNAFDWHPFVRVLFKTSTLISGWKTYTYAPICGDFKVATVLDRRIANAITDCATLGLFNISATVK